MNGRISLDTNIVIRLFKNDPLITKKLVSSSIIYLPLPVVGELLFAAQNSHRKEENLRLYNEFVNTCNCLDITRETANFYSSVRLELKKKGRPIPENDVWIASICIEHNIPLVTGDTHFDNLDRLNVIKW